MSTVSLTSGTAAGRHEEYGDPRLGWLLIVLISAAVAVGVAYIAIYLGVEYGIPSWAAQSYPPPLVR